MNSPKSALLRGTAYTLGFRTCNRLLGLASTVVMARLLAPADYGLLSMAFLVLGALEALLDFGATTALLRKPDASPEEIDAAWTLRFLQGALTALLLLAATPFAVHAFAEPRLGWILCVLAGCVLASGAGSIGPTLAQRQCDFTLEFRLQLTQALVRVACTLAAGWWLRDYRALVLGIAAAYVVPPVLSWCWHPWRPHWNLRGTRQIWQTTRWLTFAGVWNYALRKSDELLAARLGGPAALGQYSVGADVGQLPVGQVAPALLRALLPVLASLQADRTRTVQASLKTLAALNTLLWPLGLGFAAVAPLATPLLLGPQWQDAAPFVAGFALVSVLQAMPAPLVTLLVLSGHTRAQFQITLAEFATFALGCALLAPRWQLIGLMLARLAGATTGALTALLLATRHSSLAPSALGAALLRPLAGALLMAAMVRSLPTVSPLASLQLGVAVAAGALFYAAWSALTWALCGRPEGLESTLLEFALGLRRRLSPAT